MLPKRKWNVKGVVGCLHGRNRNTGLPFNTNIKRLKMIVLRFDREARPRSAVCGAFVFRFDMKIEKQGHFLHTFLYFTLFFNFRVTDEGAASAREIHFLKHVPGFYNTQS